MFSKDTLTETAYIPVLKFEKVHDLAKLPTKNHEDDTGYDLYSIEDKIITARQSAVIDVGLKFAFIPEGYWLKVESRSGLGFKYGISAHPGIIDNGYRGSAGVKLYNLTDTDYQIKIGDRVAQLVIYFNISMNVEWGKVEETNRNEKGFGSSGR
jgi:dUTP pyrophosphatase